MFYWTCGNNAHVDEDCRRMPDKDVKEISDTFREAWEIEICAYCNGDHPRTKNYEKTNVVDSDAYWCKKSGKNRTRKARAQIPLGVSRGWLGATKGDRIPVKKSDCIPNCVILGVEGDMRSLRVGERDMVKVTREFSRAIGLYGTDRIRWERVGDTVIASVVQSTLD